jgi:hypothetical protein
VTPEQTRAYRKAYHAAHREKSNAQSRTYRLAHRKEILTQASAYRAAHRGERSAATKAYYAAHRKELIAHTVAFKRARKEQMATRPKPEVCEVCGRTPNGRGLHFDHNHQTGAFRGWLCHRCNMALGLLDDSPATLRALADYLQDGKIEVRP